MTLLHHVSHVTVTELFDYMRSIGREISRDTIQRDCKSGRLVAFTVGRTFMIESASAMDYAKHRDHYDQLRRKTN